MVLGFDLPFLVERGLDGLDGVLEPVLVFPFAVLGFPVDWLLGLLLGLFVFDERDLAGLSGSGYGSESYPAPYESELDDVALWDSCLSCLNSVWARFFSSFCISASC